MNEILRKGFLLGLGAALVGKEKLESMLTDLVERNELTTEEAREVMRDFIEKAELKKGEWESRQSKKARERTERSGLATKEDIQKLTTRINEIEKRLG